MNGTFRQSMSCLHTWAGLVLGWILYFMFMTGSAGYFDEEITHWMQPETVRHQGTHQTHMLEVAQARLANVAPQASQWFVDFPVGRGYSLNIWWKEFANKDENGDGKDDGKWKNEPLHPQTGKSLAVRETGGGKVLYHMHYALHYMPKKIAYWLTSLSAMFMLVALITGIVIHKKIFKDFFTFRPGKNQRSWLDMHNVVSVLPLPFHLMITYSGLVLLMFTTMGAVIDGSFGSSEQGRDRFFDEAFSHAGHPEESDILVRGVALASLLPDIEKRWGKEQMSYVGMEGGGTKGAHIEVGRLGYSGLNREATLMYDGVSGDLLHDSSNESDKTLAATQFYNVLSNLHEGQFAGMFLRCLYFLSGLMGAGMVATGMILWAAKRREKAQKTGQASRGLVLVEHLNVGTIVGLPIGIAVYFWANRLIPVGLDGRENWEVNSLFIAWALMLVYPLFISNKRSLAYIWSGQLSLACVLYALLPVVNALTTDKHLGVSLFQGDWVMVGFDLSMLVFALCFGMAAYQLARKAYRQQHAQLSTKVIAPLEIAVP